MKKNVTRIRITFIKDHGKGHELFCDKTLMLRTAREVGDEENVNNYVLCQLKRHKRFGEIDFVKA